MMILSKMCLYCSLASAEDNASSIQRTESKEGQDWVSDCCLRSHEASNLACPLPKGDNYFLPESVHAQLNNEVIISRHLDHLLDV